MYVSMSAFNRPLQASCDGTEKAGYIDLISSSGTVTINFPAAQMAAWHEIAERINALSSAPAETSPAAPAEEAA